jgi:hypothetical protein
VWDRDREIKTEGETRLKGVLEGFLFDNFFFAMIFILGLANEHVFERNELK